MSDPNVIGHLELTCAVCGFTGTPIVAAAHDCADFLKVSKQRFESRCGTCGLPADTIPCPYCDGMSR